jgi:hypothetical protein
MYGLEAICVINARLKLRGKSLFREMFPLVQAHSRDVREYEKKLAPE